MTCHIPETWTLLGAPELGGRHSLPVAAAAIDTAQLGAFPRKPCSVPAQEAGGRLLRSILAWGRLTRARAGRASEFPGRHGSLPAASSLCPQSLPWPGELRLGLSPQPARWEPESREGVCGLEVTFRGQKVSSAVTAPLRGIGPAPQHFGLPEFLACTEVAAWLAGKRGRKGDPSVPRMPRLATQCRLHCLSEQVKCQAQTLALVAVCLPVCLSVRLSVCLPPPLSEGGLGEGLPFPSSQPQLLKSVDATGVSHRPGRWGAVQCASQGESGGFCPLLEEGQGPRPALPSHVYPSRGPHVPPQTFKALSTHPFPEPAFLAQSPTYRVLLPRGPSPIPSPRSLTPPLLPWSPSPH